MDIESYRDYCISKKGVTEGFPFDNQTLVFKVMNKMFALTDVDEFVSINLKCDPEKAIELRSKFPDAVKPGYHMNKQHWNTIMTQLVPDNLLKEWIDDSYNLIVQSLPKKVFSEWEKL